jgi:hypothetical protein
MTSTASALFASCHLTILTILHLHHRILTLYDVPSSLRGPPGSFHGGPPPPHGGPGKAGNNNGAHLMAPPPRHLLHLPSWTSSPLPWPLVASPPYGMPYECRPVTHRVRLRHQQQHLMALRSVPTSSKAARPHYSASERSMEW